MPAVWDGGRRMVTLLLPTDDGHSTESERTRALHDLLAGVVEGDDAAAGELRADGIERGVGEWGEFEYRGVTCFAEDGYCGVGELGAEFRVRSFVDVG